MTGSDGLYGETRMIDVNGERGAEVYVLPTVVPAGEKDQLLRDAIVYLTCVHETGHALGLEHTANFADIMYSFQYGGDIPEYFGRYRRLLASRADIRKHSGMSAADRRRVAEKFK
ncbi:MAG: matrixin family metalloprotease [Ignavibacteriota bacterium]